MKPHCNTYNFCSSVSAISNQAQSLRLVARLILTRNSTCWVLTCCLASSSPSSFTIWWTLSPSDFTLSTKCNACCSSLGEKRKKKTMLKNTDKTVRRFLWQYFYLFFYSFRGHFFPRSRHIGDWNRKIPKWWRIKRGSVLCFWLAARLWFSRASYTLSDTKQARISVQLCHQFGTSQSGQTKAMKWIR